MGEVDKQNETEEDENCGSDEGNVIPPEHEETVGNKEGNHDEEDPQENLRTPPSEQVVSGIHATGISGHTHFEWRPFYPECLEHQRE